MTESADQDIDEILVIRGFRPATGAAPTSKAGNGMYVSAVAIASFSITTPSPSPTPTLPDARFSMPFTVELICVDPKRVREVWPHVSPLLKAACYRTKLNAFEDIESDILAGRSLLWMAWNGRTVESAAATILINSEVGKVCIITVCGGSDMKRWLPLIEQIEAYAKGEGCKRVRIYGRKGWLHVLDGYEEKHVIMDKELG